MGRTLKRLSTLKKLKHFGGLKRPGKLVPNAAPNLSPPKMAVCYGTTPPPWLLLAISLPKWVTGGRVLTMDEVLWFYALGDFHDMARMGMNVVRIPVPCRVFHDDVVVTKDFLRTVLRLLDRAKGEGLKAILVLGGGDRGGQSGAGIVDGGTQGGPPA
jgi:hypothetical protein